MKTKFILDPIVVNAFSGNYEFWFDGNSKITAGNGSFKYPKPNAFSLVHIDDCPSATEICKEVCYVHLLEKAEQNVYDKYRINSKNIRKLMNKSYKDRFYTAMCFSNWIKKHAVNGFRWHVSGDIFSEIYAEFITTICLLTPYVKFWIYTRSYEYLNLLTDIDNLVVNLSVDKDNYNEALIASSKYNFRMCYLTMDGTFPKLPKGSVIFPNYELRGRNLKHPTDAPWWQNLTLDEKKMVCPADFFGQSEKMRCGPCKKCLI